MTNNPQTYHGEWWVPAVADHDTRMTFFQPEGMMGHEHKYTGTLTYYGDKNSTLELYHIPSGYHYSHYDYNKVLWGKDSNGRIFTLFNVAMREKRGMDFSSVTYVVGMILIGEHVLSVSENWTQKCLAYFPYLNNWMFYETQYFVTAHFGENSFQSSLGQQQVSLLQTGGNREGLSAAALSNFKILLPSKDEQQSIASYLDTKCAEIDALIAIKQSKIEELKDYKKSVIYEYVTGKKEVI